MENSDTGQELIINGEDNQQPADVVADAVEENAETLQSADEVEFELHIDDEGEPEKEPEKQPDYEMARKAFKEREEKRKKREQEEAERKALAERIKALEAENQKASLGKPPTLADCDYDEDEYQKKVYEFYQKQQAVQQTANESSKQEEAKQEVSAEILIAADKQEQQVKQKYKKYEADKTDLAMKIANDGIDPDKVMVELQSICHADGTDFAKAVIGLARVKGGYDGLKVAANSGPVAIARYIRKVAGQVKLAEAKKIDTKPEPEINSSGSVDATAASVEKLKQAWLKNSTTANYNAYKAAKSKLKR